MTGPATTTNARASHPAFMPPVTITPAIAASINRIISTTRSSGVAVETSTGSNSDEGLADTPF